jgi:purine-binding chemotaxis protein CheW
VSAATAGQAPDLPEQVLEFSLGEDRYCVDIGAVDEIVRPDEMTTLPDSPPAVEGVMDLRGATTTIVNPRLVFGVNDGVDGDQVVIFGSGGEDDRQIGWLVDRVHRVTDLPEPDREPVADNQFVEGVVSEDESFVLWVDPAEVNESTV